MGRLRAMPSRLAAPPPKLRAAPKQTDPFYESQAWRSLVASIKEERGPWCQDCGSGHRVAGDHVVEMKDGGAALDRNNVRLRCAKCHNRKTARERSKRARGLR
jgi:5-methylcytosine-specific restriction protein A